MKNLPEYFASMVFNDNIMQSRLPSDTYKSLKRTMDKGRSLDINVANIVANAMKEWAIEKGVTHFTHWFQPMTGITAEKHDSFISPTSEGRIIMEFSGKELVRGESDASSFPSGGLRATFEARGYTAWDPTSYAFIKGKTLCIPTAFCSYGGEALDKKTPLLRSMEAINRQAMRVLKLFGNEDVNCIKTLVGAEQEYFLITKEMCEKRKDLLYTGRTLFGAKPPKGQDLEDHYFGTLKPRVAAFMEELDEELWKLGILAKTEHNEAAPAQHELAPIYISTNIATDHNQLTMEIMQQVASRHGLVCLLHEKPFAGMNGSGKHNNWSIATDVGTNLLSPGETPHENAQFLLFLCAVIQAVDDYQDLLRLSAATAGNDHRLGGNEAPPAIISIFLGNELTAILNAIEEEKPYNAAEKTQMRLGVHVLPKFPKDTTDRNRTSPFAFTGNKFEFRMVGSSDSIACANIMLNTSVAESLRQYADKLENAKDFTAELNNLIKETIKNHKRIIFNGNGYDDAWMKEATEKRGLLNLRTTPDCLPYLIAEKNIALFATHKVYSEVEARARCGILLDNYCKIVNIEAQTMLELTRKEILPAISSYSATLAASVLTKRAVFPDIECGYETKLASFLSNATDKIAIKTEELNNSIISAKRSANVVELSRACRDIIIPQMDKLREIIDEVEVLTAKSVWPFPTYGDLLFGVK